MSSGPAEPKRGAPIWKLIQVGRGCDEFARASYYAPQMNEPCLVCTRGMDRSRPVPMKIGWDERGQTVGDFSLPTQDRPVVTDAVLVALERFSGFRPSSIEFAERDPTLRKKYLPKPQDVPHLTEMYLTTTVDCDIVRSSVELAKRCSGCGHETWEVFGVEDYGFHWDSDAGVAEYPKSSRLPGHGLFVDRREVEEAGVFRINQFSWLTFCTSAFRDVVVENGFTNVEFLEYGEVVG